jgi:hypothetical protein
MTRVVLGNRHAIHSVDHGATYEALPKGKRATVVDFPPGTPLTDMIKTVLDPQGVWAYHAVGVEGEQVAPDGSTVVREAIHKTAKPAWVASDSEALAAVLAEAFGGIEVRDLEEPEGHPAVEWPKEAHYGYRPEEAKGGGGGGGGGSDNPATFLPTLLAFMLLVPALCRLAMLLLKTNAGNDFQYNQMAGSASATAVGKWVALTANVTAPAAGDTTLTGEIVTGGGGLVRKAGTPAHTTGAASYTITTVFTANGSDSLPVTIGKRGIFDAASVGNMVFETLVSPTATLSASGDNLTLTDTVTM